MTWPPGHRRLLAVTLRATVVAGAARVPTRLLPGGESRWERANFRERPVSLLPGAGLPLALATCGPPAVALAATGAAAVGWYDDSVGNQPRERAAKGLRGHLVASLAGRPTAGAVKVCGLLATGVLAAAALPRRGRGHLLLDGLIVAGGANAVNLLDLRPGRALKAGLALALVSGQWRVAAVTLAALPGELAEQAMLGDTGANALGAAVTTGLLVRLRSYPSRLMLLAGLSSLTLTSEVVSLSRLIERNPVLCRIDRLGRRP